jgi:diguanylate cyclase (GGDEF)-like protein
MTVHIGTITLVLIVGHIIVFLLLLADTRQGVASAYDRAFLWGKAIQIAGWGMMILAASTGATLPMFVGNALLIAGWGLEILAMLSLKIGSNRAYAAGYVVLTLACVFVLMVPGPGIDTRLLWISALQALMYSVPGSILAFSRDESSLIQKVTGGIYLLCSLAMIARIVSILRNSANAVLPGASTDQVAAFALLLHPFLLLLCSMAYVLLKKEQLSRSLQVFAETDPLTGLSNRRAFFRLAAEYIRTAALKNDPFSLLMIDIDNFKTINDAHGHSVGDEIIASLAATLRGSIRQTDVACRFGGEEFVVLLAGCDPREAFRIAERIRATAERSEPATVRYTVSIGIAGETGASANLDALIRRADNGMYRAKALGRNRVQTEES